MRKYRNTILGACLAALLLALAPAAGAQGAQLNGRNYWRGFNKFAGNSQVNMINGFVIGSTAYDMDYLGNLDAYTLDVASTLAVIGASDLGGNVTLQNDEVLDNATNNTVKFTYGGATAALGTLTLNSQSASPADSDVLTLNFDAYNDDVGVNAETFGSITVTSLDITSTTLDSNMAFNVQTNGTGPAAPTAALTLTGAAATFGNSCVVTAPAGISVSTGSTAVQAVTGTTAAFTGAMNGMRKVITKTTDTTLSAAEVSFTMVVVSASEDDTTVTLTLPTAAAGYDVIFVDDDATAGADLSIKGGTDDTVGGSSATKIYEHGNASTNDGIAHFVTYNAVDWTLLSTPIDSASWHVDNN